MAFCERCGKPLDGETFCSHCGIELENPDSMVMASATNTPSVKKKGGIALMVGCVAIVVLGGSYYTFGSGKEKEELLNETEAIEEVAILGDEKEVADESNDKVVELEKVGKVAPQLLYQHISILDLLTDGSLDGTFHIGRTRDELINKIGPAIVEYFREGESRLDYSDATYMLSPTNDRIYSVMLLLDSDETADFQDIRNTLGKGTEAILADSGVEDTNTHYLSYGTEDSLITFYSDSEEGQPVNKIIYSNVSVYSAKTPVVQKETLNHPGEIEPIVLEIRKEYHAINENITSMKKMDVGRGKIAYLNEEGIVRKIVEKATEGSVEYYFDKKQGLLFTFQQRDSVEDRFYFVENQMIRWISPSKITMDYDAGQSNSEYKEWETTWLEQAHE